MTETNFDSENKVLKVNKIKCIKCNDILNCISNNMKWCSCGSVAIDGGLSYGRRLGNREDYEELSEYKTDGEVEQEIKARLKLDEDYLLSDNILKVLKWSNVCNKMDPYLVSMRKSHLKKSLKKQIELLQKEIEQIDGISIVYGKFNDVELL
jgi:hypothetical protein